MLLSGDDAVMLAPDVEHGLVYDVRQRPLRIKGDGRADGVWVGAASPEPPLAAGEGDEVPDGGELRGNPLLPSLVSGERGEVLGLEGGNDFDGELALLRKSVRLPTIIRTVAKFLTHESVAIMSIVRLLGDMFVSLKITSPGKAWPANARNCCVRIARFAGLEISSVIK